MQGAAAFSKFMAILQIVSEAESPLTVAEIARIATLSRPTAYRIVAALIAEDMLHEDAGSGRLTLGPRLVSLAARSLEQSDLRHVARPALERLRDTLDETLHLAVNIGPEMVYIDKLESHRAVAMRSRIGTRTPLHSSSVGKAWLASLPPARAEEIARSLDFARKTEHSLTTADALLAELATARLQGFATDLEENESEICCYGMAIPAPEGEVPGCISISIPRYRFTERPRDEILQAMRLCVQRISESLHRL